MNEVVEHLMKAYDTRMEECVGYHGTSLEAVEYMVENGALLGRTFQSDRLVESRLGDFSFHPIKGKVGHALEDTFLDLDEAFERVVDYALINARKHAFLKTMGFDISDEVRGYDATILTDSFYNREQETMFDTYVGEGFSKQKLRTAVSFARDRRGFVLGLDEKIVSRYDLLEGDENEGDLCIHCPDGLPYRLVSVIIPMGGIEEEYLLGLEE